MQAGSNAMVSMVHLATFGLPQRQKLIPLTYTTRGNEIEHITYGLIP